MRRPGLSVYSPENRVSLPAATAGTPAVVLFLGRSSLLGRRCSGFLGSHSATRSLGFAGAGRSSYRSWRWLWGNCYWLGLWFRRWSHHHRIGAAHVALDVGGQRTAAVVGSDAVRRRRRKARRYHRAAGLVAGATSCGHATTATKTGLAGYRVGNGSRYWFRSRSFHGGRSRSSCFFGRSGCLFRCCRWGAPAVRRTPAVVGLLFGLRQRRSSYKECAGQQQR